jgi:hypothetical protein
MYTLKTFPMGKVWGGYKVYGGSKQADILPCLYNFINNPNPDPKAAIIVTINQAAGNEFVWQIFYFYNGEIPSDNAFAHLEKVKATVSFVKVRSYAELLKFNGAGAGSTGERSVFRVSL